MNKFKRSVFILLFFSMTVILSLTLSGCKVSKSEDDRSGSDTDDRINSYIIADSTGDWGFPSPYTHYSRGSGYIRMHFIFETLVWKNDAGFVPQLASEWEFDRKDNAFILKLQKDAKWQDDTPFTAEDVLFTFNYTKKHPYQWVDSRIVKSCKIMDKFSVKLYLDKSYAPFLQDVACTQPIIPKHIWQNVDEPAKFTAPEAVIGTGPYMLADYNKELGTYLYKANDSYYLGNPAAGEIRFVKISEQLMPAALKDGSVSSTSIPPEITKDIKAKNFTVITPQPGWNGKLTINHKKAPLLIREFRHALAYAINREDLVKVVFRGHAEAGSPGILPPSSIWYNPETAGYDYNQEKAREIITKLGYRSKGGFFFKDKKPLKLSLIVAANYKDAGQFIAQELEKVGIRIDFRTMEAKTIDSKVEAWNFDLSIYGHGGLYEPSILNKVIIGKGYNSARYDSNNELTGLVKGQLMELEAKKRKEMVFRIQELYAQDLPALTLYYPKSYWAHDGRLSLYYTIDGVASGIPIPLNRMCFVKGI